MEKPSIEQGLLTCGICGVEFHNPTQEELILHVVTEHPMDLLKMPKVQAMIVRAGLELGQSLGDFVKGLHR